MRYYEAARAVPPEAKKSFSNGKFSGTDISPMWRIKKLTELFGPAGIGWYTQPVSVRYEQHGADHVMALVDINLFVKVDGEWSRPIFGTGGNLLLRKGVPSDEGYKMAYTDALSVACKALGIGADVYFEKDASKYSPPDAPKQPPNVPGIDREQIMYIKTHTTPDNLKKLLAKYNLRQLSDMSAATARKVITQLSEREKEAKADEQGDPDRQSHP